MGIARKLFGPVVLLLTFVTVAVVLWRTTGKIFFLFNFGYIGAAVAVCVGLFGILPKKKKPLARRVAQTLVGGYLLIFLGLIGGENMQLEGFFFHLLAGFFAASIIHYLVAKVFGPLLYGRGYCGWACWTAMVIDFLPYKTNKNGRLSARWEWLRYAHFALSLSLVLFLWYVVRYRPDPLGPENFTWLIVGNVFYFVSAIILALVLKDNRAFCKYLCPVSVVLKLFTRFSMLKVAATADRCVGCSACSRACPMDIDVMGYIQNGDRVLSTECIGCHTCTHTCPTGILTQTFSFDVGGQERIRRRTQPNIRGAKR